MGKMKPSPMRRLEAEGNLIALNVSMTLGRAMKLFPLLVRQGFAKSLATTQLGLKQPTLSPE